jgi:hypothetical protein
MILKRERTGTLYAFAARSGSSSHRCLDREVAHRVAYSKNFCRTARHLRARRETVRFKGAGRRRCCVGFAQTDDRVPHDKRSQATSSSSSAFASFRSSVSKPSVNQPLPVGSGGTGATSKAGVQALVAPGQIILSQSVNFNVANTDAQFPVTLPTGFTRYLVTSVRISGASASLTTATAGLFTAASGGRLSALVATGKEGGRGV